MCFAARRALDEMQELLDPTCPSWCRTTVGHGLGFCAYFAGRPDEAREHFDAALELHRRQGGDAYFVEQSELMQLWVGNALGEFEAVVHRAQEIGNSALAIVPRNRAKALAAKGVALLALGRLQEAEVSLAAAVPLLKRAFNSARLALKYSPCLLARQGRVRMRLASMASWTPPRARTRWLQTPS